MVSGPSLPRRWRGPRCCGGAPVIPTGALTKVHVTGPKVQITGPKVQITGPKVQITGGAVTPRQSTRSSSDHLTGQRPPGRLRSEPAQPSAFGAAAQHP